MSCPPSPSPTAPSPSRLAWDSGSFCLPAFCLLGTWPGDPPTRGENRRRKVGRWKRLWGRNSGILDPWVKLPPFPARLPLQRMKTEIQELDPPTPQFSRALFTKFPPYLSHRALAPRACPRAPRARRATSGPVGPAHLPSPQGSPGPPLPGGISFNFGICSIPNVKDPKTSVPWGVPKAQWREGKMLEGIRDSDPRDGAGPHVGLGQCQPECASCGSNSARGDAAPYLPHSGGFLVGHPLLDRFLKSGRAEARLEVLGAAFHPLALARLGAVFIPETLAWKNERRRHAPPPPRLSLLAAGDCAAIKPWSPPLLSSQPCPFWGRRAELRLWRQGTHS